MSIKQASLQMSLQFLSVFFFFSYSFTGHASDGFDSKHIPHIFYGRGFSHRNKLIFILEVGFPVPWCSGSGPGSLAVSEVF